MKKVIFLDVDGVLNSDETGFGGFFGIEKVLVKDDVKWGDVLVDRIRTIVKETGANIVISSTWRRHFDIPKFGEMFGLYDWPDVPIIDMTPKLHQGRGVEVNAWLQKNPVDRYVIIDDVDQFLPDQKEFFIQTSIMTGITQEDTIQAIKILNKK